MPTLPARVKEGQQVSAAWANQMLDFMLASQPRSGPGLVSTQTAQGTILALARLIPEHLVPAVITQVHGSDRDLVEDVKYSAAAIGRPGAVVENAAPVYGRIFAEGVATKPAAVNDLCLIVRVPQDDGSSSEDLWIFSEGYYVKRCEGSTAGRSSGSLRNDPFFTGIPLQPPPPPPTGGSGRESIPVGGGEI